MRRHDEIDEFLGDSGPTARGAADRAVSDDEAEPEAIRVEIEQTRTEMSGTIDAIQRKLDPEVLAEQAKDVAREVAEQAKEAAREVTAEAVRDVKVAAVELTDHAVGEAKDAAREMTGQAKDAAWDATVGRAEEAVSSAGETAKGVGSIMLETIKQNPVPAALAGLTLGWLYMNRSGGPAARTAAGPYGTVDSSYRYRGAPTAYPAGSPQAYRATPHPQAYEDGQSTIGEVADKVGETASRAGEKAGELVSSASDAAVDLASSAGTTVKDTGSGIVETIKENPLPASLIGLGLGWLWMNRSSGRPTQYGSASYAYGESRDRRGMAGYPYPEDRAGIGDRSQDPGVVGSTVDTARETAGQVAEGAQELAGQARDKVGDVVGGVQETAGDLVDQAQYQTRRAGGRVEEMVRDNPLMMAGVATALGAAAGFALPATRREDQLMGKARDSFVGQAQEVTQETMEKVERVAGEAQTTVQKEAEREGLAV